MTSLPTESRWVYRRLRSHVGELIRLAVPIVVARLGILTMVLADTVMVGRFSSAELAYQSIGQVLVNPIMITAVGLLMGTMVMTAQAFGGGDRPEAGAVWRRSLPYALALGLVTAVPCAFGETLLLWTGQTPELAREGGRVMQIIGLGLPAYLIYLVTAFFLEGIKRPMPGMLMMLAANVLNVLLNWLLVFGTAGLPAMGAVGSAWATTAVRIFLAVGVCAYVLTMREQASFAVRRRPGGGWHGWRRQRRLGYAAGASMGTESAAFAVMGVFAGWLGVLPLGAFSIAFTIVAMAFMVAVGVGGATAVLVGGAHGRGDHADTALAGWTGLGVNSVGMAVIGLGLLLAPGAIAAFFTNDPALIALAAPLVAFSAFILLADGGQAVMANALRGRGETWVPTAMHLFSYFVIMVPVSWLFAFPLDRGAIGLLEGILIASLVSIAVQSSRFAWLARRDAAA